MTTPAERWLRRLFGLPPKHRHDWHYRPRRIGGTGWGIAECRTCGATDLY